MSTAEFYLLPSSKLIGMTLGGLVKKYQVKLEHYHTLSLSPDTRCPYDPNSVMTARMHIKIEGKWEDVSRVIKDST